MSHWKSAVAALKAMRNQLDGVSANVDVARAGLLPQFNVMLRQDWNDKDLGFDSKKILYTEINPRDKMEFETIKTRMLQHPEIADISFSSTIPFIGNIGGYVTFTTKSDAVILMKIGTSFTSIENARKNLETEIPDWNFNKTKAELENTWNEYLGKIELVNAPEDDKIKFYTRIYDCLTESGQFINADVVLASTDYHQQVYMSRWIEFINKSVPMDEIMNKWIPTYHAEDKPAKLTDQFRWLEQIGFRSVDVIWKYYNFCVYGGIK